MSNSKNTFGNYLFKKGLFQYGLPTAVLCLIIYLIITKEPILLSGIGFDLLISVFVTVFICTLTMVPGVHGDKKKDKIPAAPLTRDVHPVYKHLPRNLVLFSLVIALLATVVFSLVPAGLIVALQGFGVPDITIPTVAWAIIKSVYSGFMVMVSIMVAASATACEA